MVEPTTDESGAGRDWRKAGVRVSAVTGFVVLVSSIAFQIHQIPDERRAEQVRRVDACEQRTGGRAVVTVGGALTCRTAVAENRVCPDGSPTSASYEYTPRCPGRRWLGPEID